MINLFDTIKNNIYKEIKEYKIPVQISWTPHINHGYIASNFIKILQSKKIDEGIIANIVTNIQHSFNGDFIEKFEIKDGFFNIFLNKNIIIKILNEIITISQDNFFQPNENLKKYLQDHNNFHWEFGSINPTGPIHLGHLRAIFFANGLIHLYENFKIPVYKEYFLNDCGFQIHQFMESIYKRWQQTQGIVMEEDTIPYKGNYIKDLIPLKPFNNFEELMDQKDAIIETVKNKTIKELENIGVKYDAITYESKLRNNSDFILKILNILKDKSLIGFMENQNDLLDLDEDIEPITHVLKAIPNETIILLTKSLGFKKNKVIMKNKDLTYFGADIIYLYDKYYRGFHNQYCFLGEDHIGHLSMLKSLSEQLFQDAKFIPKKVGFVKVFDENDQLIAMSKRQGKFLSMDDAIKKIGLDFLKLIMISRNNNGEIHFKVKDAHDVNIKNNCLFYIQYCYARITSLINRCKPLDTNWNFDMDKIEILEEEHFIIRQLVWLNWLANQWVIEEDIHGLYNYLYNLCTYFHSYYSLGSVDVRYKIINQEDDNYQFKLRILHSVKKVLFMLLKIIDIQPLEKM